MRKLTVFLAFLALTALPALAADSVIERGIDLWRTTEDGSTHIDLAEDPLPAGFFCAGSAPYTGDIGFKGVPIVTEPAGLLGHSDTVVERLDDAIFNERGVAYTRVQVRAMTFVGLEPVRTECGTYEVRVFLHGEQPVTQMRILRDHDFGGRFYSPISVDVRLVFSPIDHKGPSQEILRSLRFAPMPDGRWAQVARRAPGAPDEVLVDTDGDRRPDAYLPVGDGFVAGMGMDETGQARLSPVPECHCDWETCAHQHCIQSIYICNGTQMIVADPRDCDQELF